MKKHSEPPPGFDDQRNKIIGLGESSIRKSYYPELQQKLSELQKKNEELNAAYEDLTATEEELKQNYNELSRRERDLRVSEERYRTIIETTETGFVILDLEGRVVDANANYVQLTGHRDLSEILGLSIIAWTAPSDKEKNAGAFRQCLRDGFIRNLEIDYVDGTGRITPVEINATVVTHEESFRIISLCRDISSRRKVEAALRESENLYGTLADAAQDLIYIINRDDTIGFVNTYAAAMIGKSRQDIIGRPRSAFFPGLAGEQQYRNIEHVLTSGIPRRMVNLIHLPTRDTWQDTELVPLKNPDGLITAVMGISRDITSLKQAEEALRAATGDLQTIIDGSPDMIYIHDKTGRVIDVNENVVTKLGFSREEMLQSEPEMASSEGFSTTMAMQQITSALREGSASFEWVSRKKNGEEFPVEVRLRRLESVSAEGNPEYRVLAIVRDITEQKRTGQIVQQARKKLNLLNTVIFQDVQTAAFSLSAYHELIKNIVTEPKAKTYLDKEVSLVRSINDALDFARNYQEMGIHPPRWQNVNQVFLFAISHLNFLDIEHHAGLANLQIFADPLLEKAFFKLMENVLRHGKTATAVTLTFEEKQDGLVIIIEDNGVGIQKEEKNMIFDRGYGKDAGLGLFLVREILSITGMTIQETGTEGKGARFEIHVPKGVYRFEDGK